MTRKTLTVAGLATLVAAVVMLGVTVADRTTERAKRDLWADVDFKITRLQAELGFRELSPEVHKVLVDTPREQFMPEKQRAHAFENRPVPIGYGQTISQPLIVAIMTELLAVKPGDRVFELGTGSAYQAAILDALDTEVYSIEIVPELAERARQTLDRLGHDAVHTRVGDGYFGWEEAAPFDAIIVTAANDHIPPPLLRQLKPGGRMLIPVGGRYSAQKLVLVKRDISGTIRTREILPVSFVPLTGRH